MKKTDNIQELQISLNKALSKINEMEKQRDELEEENDDLQKLFLDLTKYIELKKDHEKGKEEIIIKSNQVEVTKISPAEKRKLRINNV